MDNRGKSQCLGIEREADYSDDSAGSQTRKSDHTTDFDFFYANTTSDDDTDPSYHLIDATDPLRYFLESGEITPNEYDRWRIVKQKVPTDPTDPTDPTTPSDSSHHKNNRLDFGAGYNSESDTDDDTPITIPTVVSYRYIYGNGYSSQYSVGAVVHDSWNPTPDTTGDRRYTKLANDGEYKLTRFTQWSSSQHLQERKSRKMTPKLGTSFELKIEWERFIDSSSNSHAVQRRTLQDFWPEHALQIYEALQELKDREDRARGRGRGVVCATPKYHTTPFETLENTFETIGRMSRCIAEDFNAESVVEYVEEFMKALYREIEFNALVEEYENRIGDAEYETEKLRKAVEKSVMSSLTTSAEHDFIARCDDQSRMPWCCEDD